jgi:hypothetical protein
VNRGSRRGSWIRPASRLREAERRAARLSLSVQRRGHCSASRFTNCRPQRRRQCRTPSGASGITLFTASPMLPRIWCSGRGGEKRSRRAVLSHLVCGAVRWEGGTAPGSLAGRRHASQWRSWFLQLAGKVRMAILGETSLSCAYEFFDFAGLGAKEPSSDNSLLTIKLLADMISREIKAASPNQTALWAKYT